MSEFFANSLTIHCSLWSLSPTMLLIFAFTSFTLHQSQLSRDVNRRVLFVEFHVSALHALLDVGPYLVHFYLEHVLDGFPYVLLVRVHVDNERELVLTFHHPYRLFRRHWVFDDSISVHLIQKASPFSCARLLILSIKSIFQEQFREQAIPH